MSNKKENGVSVAVRIRPRNEKEIQADMPVAFSPSEDFRDVQELNEDCDVVKRWSYDFVFGPDNNNKSIFDAMGAKLVDAALDGYNSVLFMYGQTSSGESIFDQIPFISYLLYLTSFSFSRKNFHVVWGRRNCGCSSTLYGIL